MSGARRPRARQTVLRLSMRVWDLPTRLFYWAIPLLVAADAFSIQHDRGALHLLCLHATLALLLFRVAWGVVGSETSRFSQFVRGPAAVIRDLAQLTGQGPDDQVGHSASGGWLLLLLLGDLGVETGTGLFSEGPPSPGPLAHLISQPASEALTTVHAYSFGILVGLIGVHVLAILAYAGLKKQNVLRPMITGRKRLPGATRQPRIAPPLLAIMLAILAACLAWLVATRF